MKLFVIKNKTLLFFGAAVALAILYLILATQVPAVKMRVFVFAILFFGEIYLWSSILKAFQDTWKNKIPFFSLLVLYWMPACVICFFMFILATKGVHQLNKTVYLTVVGICIIQYLIKFLLFILLLVYDLITIGIRKYCNIDKGKRILLRFSLGIYFAAFVLMIYGTVYEADDFRVREINIDCRGVIHTPLTNHGVKIVLISDLHLACWRNPESIEKAVKLVIDQQPDLLFITGDVVQFTSDEMVEYMPILSQLKAKYGIFSVLGNHDYGRYANFKTDSLRKEDIYRLVLFQTLLGWKVLNNESVKLYEDSIPLGITIAGVEFYSPKKMFINEGDLIKTFQNVDTNDYVILLSHDPQAWYDVVNKNLPANLTLSGHTHGMQLGFYSKNLKFSPASLLYKHWGGLYERQEKLLYVNVGLGAVGFPARVGMPPEITVIIISV
jgi:predicted MPP superfamily phosphohydrolase